MVPGQAMTPADSIENIVRLLCKLVNYSPVTYTVWPALHSTAHVVDEKQVENDHNIFFTSFCFLNA